MREGGEDGLFQAFPSCKETLNSLISAILDTKVGLTPLPQAGPEPAGIRECAGVC